MSDSQFLIGKLIDGAGEPDAIHIATMPVTAAETLKPGQHIGFEEGGLRVMSKPPEPYKLIGIVDPFLAENVTKGQRFFMFLYPNTITGLRHVWTHPAFEKKVESPVSVDSEAWLRSFCETADCPKYERVMELIEKGEIKEEYGTSYYDEEYLHFSGSDAHATIPPEFWNHVEVVLGKKIGKRPTYFSCSC